MSKSNHRNRRAFLRKRKVNNSDTKALPAFAVLRIHHLSIDAEKVRQSISILRRSRLRHYVTAFLKEGLKMVVCVNTLSQSEQAEWNALQSFFT